MANPSDQRQPLNDMMDMSNSEHMFILHLKKCGSNQTSATPVWSSSKRLQELQTQIADVRSARTANTDSGGTPQQSLPALWCAARPKAAMATCMRALSAYGRLRPRSW